MMMALMSATCKKNQDEEDEHPATPYSPILVAEGTKVMKDGVYYLNFVITCTSDNIRLNSIVVTGPNSLNQSFDGQGQTFQMNEGILLLWDFPYKEGKYTFTVSGLISGGNYNGSSFTKETYWTLIIP